ncbi:transposase [Kangiella koreensis]|nr:transposase [Kangiella koreensis]
MKRKQTRTFTEFKYDTASLVLDQGYSFTEACRVLDVHDNTLRNWVKRLS